LPDHLDTGRVTADMRFHFGVDLIGGLRLDEPDIALRERLMRQNGLRARATVPTVQPIDRKGRPRRKPLVEATLYRLIELRQIKRLLDRYTINR